MVRQREVRAQLAIDPDYLRSKQEAAKRKPLGALGGSEISPEMQRKIRAAMARAEAAGRPIEKLSLKIIQDIIISLCTTESDRLIGPLGPVNSRPAAPPLRHTGPPALARKPAGVCRFCPPGRPLARSPGPRDRQYSLAPAAARRSRPGGEPAPRLTIWILLDNR
jgi:hypothetical protein